MNKEFKYDAFISYRHCNPDKFVAENLHRILETYELPKNLKQKLNINGRTIKRVFRDQEELPLSSNLEDPIIDALNNSKYLIVICSPRLKESLWCKKEIETFKKIRGRENIFCVLVEGEPNESFPDDVLFDEVKVKDKSGKTKTEKKYYEPLAADVRADNKKEMLKKIKDEKLRLIAPMYNLDYDDLKQRHKQRRMKKIAYIASIASCVFFLFALYSTIMFLKINSQQKKLKLNQAINLANESKNYLLNDSKYNAVKSAYEALTEFKGVNMPYIPDSEYALVDALGVYDAGLSYKSSNELRTKGVIDYTKVSINNNYALTYDESEEIVLWDLNKLKKLQTYKEIDGFSIQENSFTFINEDYIAYINKDGNVNIYEIKSGKKVSEIKKKNYSYRSIKSDQSGKYLVINDSPTLYVYDTKKFNELAKYNTKNTISNDMFLSVDGSHAFISTSKNNFNLNEKDNLILHVFDTKTLKELNSFELESRYIEGIVENKNNIFILSNQSTIGLSQMYATSYNYKDGKVNWTKKFDKSWGRLIERSYFDGENTIAITNGNVVTVLDQKDGSIKRTFALKSEAIGLYSYSNSNMYLIFTASGLVHFISLDYGESIINQGLFNLNLDNYKNVIRGKNGYFLSSLNENRLIYYEQNSNKKVKQLDIKLSYVSNDSISSSKYDELKQKLNIKKKNLVSMMLYNDKKDLIFISYKDSTLGVYSVKDKKLLKMIDGIKDASHYYGKDKYNRIYIGSIGDAYILDDEYNKVGHINNLAKVDKKNNEVIIMHNDKCYSLPIYNLKMLLKEAKEYLKK